jgi:hypothetical protein
MIAARVVDSWRWRSTLATVVDPPVPSLWLLTRTNLFAQFTNIWFPSFLGGEGVRVWKIARAVGDSRRVALSVVLDRLTGTAVLGAAGVPLLVLFPVFVPDLRPLGDRPLLLGATVAFVGMLVAAAIWMRSLLASWIRRTLRYFADHKFLVGPALISLISLLTLCAAYAVVLAPFAEMRPVTVAALTIIPRFGRMVPISALGVGAVEGGTLVVGAYLGFEPQTMVVVVSMHIASKYVAAVAGIALEAIVEGGGTVRRVLLHAAKVPEEDVETDEVG